MAREREEEEDEESSGGMAWWILGAVLGGLAVVVTVLVLALGPAVSKVREAGKRAEEAKAKRGDPVDGAKEDIVGEFVTVRVMSVAVETTPMSSFNEKFSKEPVLVVRLRIANMSEAKKIDYEGWGGETIGKERAILEDEHKNEYKRYSPGLSDRPAGQLIRESIRPGEYVDDVLAFERPIAGVKRLLLTLRGTCVGQNAPLQFWIPVAQKAAAR